MQSEKIKQFNSIHAQKNPFVGIFLGCISINLSITPSSLNFQFPASGKNFQEAQANLNQAAAGLNQSANELVQASRGTTQDLAKASGKFGQDFSHFLEAGVDMAGQSQVGAQFL